MRTHFLFFRRFNLHFPPFYHLSLLVGIWPLGKEIKNEDLGGIKSKIGYGKKVETASKIG